MLSNNDVARIYDTVLSIPGMNETIKMDFKISRKQVLLLCGVIEKGLMEKDGDDELLANMPEEAQSELLKFVVECLEKAGLTELKTKLDELARKEADTKK